MARRGGGGRSSVVGGLDEGRFMDAPRTCGLICSLAGIEN